MNIGDTVRVIKTFFKDRTSCPVIGTLGTVTDIESEWIKVRFELPFRDTRGFMVGEETPDAEPHDIYFHPDEIERTS